MDDAVLVKDVVFSREQHKIWETLFKDRLPRVMQHACQDYIEGFELLGLPETTIPSIDFLNERITPRTGWRCVRTSVRYTDAVPWYGHFARREFLITDYLRSREELEWTPEPDVFHDVFGHLPFMTLPHYAELEDMFAPAFLRAKTDDQRSNIKRLAWYSTEFGMIRENGELKLFGAGLMSGAAELENAVHGQVPLMPYKIENVIPHDKAVWEHNKVLFVFDSIDELKRELASYLDTI
jgi:phenylalanine-4-hydroxylase